MSGRKVNEKGRNPGGAGRFIMVSRSLTHSPQFSALAPTSRALFFELQAMFNGTNNGAIFLSCKDAGDRLGLSDLKAVRGAFDELRDLGFITETIGASFAIKAGRVSKARAWNLNWIVRGYGAGPDCCLHSTSRGSRQPRNGVSKDVAECSPGTLANIRGKNSRWRNPLRWRPDVPSQGNPSWRIPPRQSAESPEIRQLAAWRIPPTT